MTHVLIPCKPLDLGKSRLSGALDAGSRRRLCERMLRQTLMSATEAFGAAQVRVVSADARVRAIANYLAVTTLLDEAGNLNGALDAARHQMLRSGGSLDRLMILPIDLPYVDAPTLCRVAAEDCPVVIVPDRDFDGTNLLCIAARYAGAFPFRYGPNSFRSHLDAAREGGAMPTIIADQRIAFDLDGPDDYRKWTGRVAA